MAILLLHLCSQASSSCFKPVMNQSMAFKIVKADLCRGLFQVSKFGVGNSALRSALSNWMAPPPFVQQVPVPPHTEDGHRVEVKATATRISLAHVSQSLASSHESESNVQRRPVTSCSQ